MVSNRARLRAALAAAATIAVVACSQDSMTGGTTTLEDGSQFVVRVVAPGDGPAIAAGQVASVHYTGWLYEPEAPNERGSQFDSSLERGTPFQFPLGQGRVIRGWDVGVEGMQIGEQRELIIPAIWAYGDRGAGGVIPPGATLLFEVELLGID